MHIPEHRAPPRSSLPEPAARKHLCMLHNPCGHTMLREHMETCAYVADTVEHTRTSTTASTSKGNRHDLQHDPPRQTLPLDHVRNCHDGSWNIPARPHVERPCAENCWHIQHWQLLLHSRVPGMSGSSLLRQCVFSVFWPWFTARAA